MKGRMQPYLPELTIRDYNIYLRYLRGVRRQLYEAYGLYSCHLLRYNGVVFAILSGFYGLLFGAYCSLPYIVIGTVGGGIKSGLIMAFNWWVAGIPYDILHGISNFFVMLVLYHPVHKVMQKIKVSMI